MTDLPWGTNQNLTDEEFYNRTSELINIKKSFTINKPRPCP